MSIANCDLVVFYKNSELFAEDMHLFVIKYHQLCQIPWNFVKYVKYLSNITVFDRNSLMKRSTGAPLHQRISVKNRDIWQILELFDKFSRYLTNFVIEICQIPQSFVKYFKYLSNIAVFDRNPLMKRSTLKLAWKYVLFFVR